MTTELQHTLWPAESKSGGVLAIVGPRNHTPPREELAAIVAALQPSTIATGCAAGVDRAARELAGQCGAALAVFRADWRRWQRAAGPKRNRELAEYVARHDGAAIVLLPANGVLADHPGTKSAVHCFQSCHVPYTIHRASL